MTHAKPRLCGDRPGDCCWAQSRAAKGETAAWGGPGASLAMGDATDRGLKRGASDTKPGCIWNLQKGWQSVGPGQGEVWLGGPWPGRGPPMKSR